MAFTAQPEVLPQVHSEFCKRWKKGEGSVFPCPLHSWVLAGSKISTILTSGWEVEVEGGVWGTDPFSQPVHSRAAEATALDGIPHPALHLLTSEGGQQNPLCDHTTNLSGELNFSFAEKKCEL